MGESGYGRSKFHLLRQRPCTPKTLLYVPISYSVCSPSFSFVLLQSFILCSGPSCLRSFILSVVVPRRGLYCMTLIYVFLSNPDLFILSEYAFDYCFVYSVTLSMHYCDYYCD